MKLDEIALGSKQHHELVAAARKKKTTITVGEFKRKLADSTMPMAYTTKLDDELDGRKADKILTRSDIEQLCAITDVDLGEVLDIIALDEAAKPAAKKYVVIGNPGRSQPSALYPKTEAPKLYTEKAAKAHVDKLNDKPAMTYGALPSQVHWHAKPIEDAMNYVMGPKAVTSIRLLQQDLNPSDEGWGTGPAKGRF